MFSRRFLFGEQKTEPDDAETGTYSRQDSEATGMCGRQDGERAGMCGRHGGEVVWVHSSDLYCPETGYGFVTEQNKKEQEFLRIPELNAAFDPVYWYRNYEMTQICENEYGCYVDSAGIVAQLEAEAARRIPLCFKLTVPKAGNYLVTVTFRTEAPSGQLQLFTGRRRMCWRGEIPGDTVFKVRTVVNVCDIIPRGETRVYEDRTVDLAVVADRPLLTALTVTEVECPTVYLAGDSTVTDQNTEYPYAPGTSYCGWGQMLTAYLDQGIGLSNHAHSGLTTASFREEGHYAVVEQNLKPGDYLFLQFGHNDQKLTELMAGEGYRSNLIRYVEECRKRLVYPVIVTPLARNSWKGNDGCYNDLLEEYAAVCLATGRELDVPVLDLHQKSMDFIIGKGLEASKAFFYPGDFTHSNDYGACQMAAFVAEEIRRTCAEHRQQAYRLLAEHVTEGFGNWEAEGAIRLPVRPAFLADRETPEETAALLAEEERLTEPVLRAEALSMIIKTMGFFPTNVYNDMYRDVTGHEWYAGTIQCACQNGILEEHLLQDNCVLPLKEVTREEFLVLLLNGAQSRKALPEKETCPYDGSCHDYARTFLQAACGMGLLAEDGSSRLKEILSRGEAVELCRRVKHFLLQ